jgi:hypothetical protein
MIVTILDQRISTFSEGLLFGKDSARQTVPARPVDVTPSRHEGLPVSSRALAGDRHAICGENSHGKRARNRQSHLPSAGDIDRVYSHHGSAPDALRQFAGIVYTFAVVIPSGAG